MRRTTYFFVFAFAMLAIAPAANAQKDRFVGSFAAQDSNTGGITRLMLFDDDTVNVWGKCHPTDCDWGTESIAAYGSTADSDLVKSAGVMSAVYVKNHAVTILIIKPLTNDRLSVEVFTRFTDRTGRTAYAAKYIMVREHQEP